MRQKEIKFIAMKSILLFLIFKIFAIVLSITQNLLLSWYIKDIHEHEIFYLDLQFVCSKSP